MNKQNTKHLQSVVDNLNYNINLHLNSETLTAILVDRTNNFDKNTIKRLTIKQLHSLSKKTSLNHIKEIYIKSNLSNYEYNRNFQFRETSKFVASFNIAKYFSINMNFSEKESLDYPTMLGYFGLIKMTNTWRALESYLNLIDKLDNSKELRSNLINEIDKNNKLKDICFDLNSEKNHKRESFFSYLDTTKIKYNGENGKEQEKKRYTCLDSRENYRSLSLFYLAKDIRNTFIHSNISASSGSGNPNVSTVICFSLSEHIMNVLNNQGKELFLTFIEDIENKK